MHQPLTSAQRTLVQDHIDFSDRIATQMLSTLPRHCDRNDICAAGHLGLMDAATRFDPSEGTPFAAFAARRIRGAVIDSLRAQDWRTRATQDQHRSLTGAEDALRARGASTDTRAVAAELGVTVERVQEISASRARRYTDSIDVVIDLGQDVAAPEGHADPAVIVEAGTTEEILRSCIGTLPAPERHVIEQVYFGERLKQDVAADMGVTPGRVSQLLGSAHTRLRRAYEARTRDPISV